MMRRRYLPIAFLFLTTILWAAEPAPHAQEHAPTQQQGHTPEPHSTPAAGHAAPAHGAEGGAAHGSDAHHGPEIKLFGMTLGPFGQFMLKVFNFAVFFFGLFFLLKGALSSAFKTRTKELQELLGQAERDKAEGLAQMRDLETKMTGLQEELDGIMVKAESDAELEKQRILEAARQEADQILAQTRQEIEFQKRLAEQELRALVAELAVQGAADRLQVRVQGATAERVLDRSIEQVGGAE